MSLGANPPSGERWTTDCAAAGPASRFNTLELATLTDELPEALARVGPFTLQVFWFNRRLLTGIEGIGSLKQVRAILATWAGGVSLYRDSYRVNPYGGPNDDWLDLDRDAFSTSGFKLNRGQIVGRANIYTGLQSLPHGPDQPRRTHRRPRESGHSCPFSRRSWSITDCS